MAKRPENEGLQVDNEAIQVAYPRDDKILRRSNYHSVAPDPSNDNLGNDYWNEKQGKNASENSRGRRTICGLALSVFWVVVSLLVLILAAGIGAGIGAGLAAQKKTSTR